VSIAERLVELAIDDFLANLLVERFVGIVALAPR